MKENKNMIGKQNQRNKEQGKYESQVHDFKLNDHCVCNKTWP